MYDTEQGAGSLHKHSELSRVDFDTGTPEKSRILQPDQGFVLRLRGQDDESVLPVERLADRIAPGTGATTTETAWPNRRVHRPAVADHVRQSPSQPRPDRRGTRGCVRSGHLTTFERAPERIDENKIFANFVVWTCFIFYLNSEETARRVAFWSFPIFSRFHCSGGPNSIPRERRTKSGVRGPQNVQCRYIIPNSAV